MLFKGLELELVTEQHLGAIRSRAASIVALLIPGGTAFANRRIQLFTVSLT